MGGRSQCGMFPLMDVDPVERVRDNAMDGNVVIDTTNSRCKSTYFFPKESLYMVDGIVCLIMFLDEIARQSRRTASLSANTRPYFVDPS